ncbi:tyrosine-type recombinase/integrase [Nocardia puris]|uniref:site-specific integrase n=1 Tax=Nocardia puris TaxID=208602 RepID=UPI0018939A33|nr:tyrosine-type recombinase/integrase [Nocardia puris]MBF6459846.1 tyrosine-type recombinase/integrase [Nocardia puris]
MPRERLAPGEWGKITVKAVRPGKFTASTYVRDADGKRRPVERSGGSREAAERNLKRHLKTRRAPLVDATVNDRTTLAELFEVWIKTKTNLAPQSVKNYKDIWKVHGKEQIGSLRIREFPTSRAEQHLGKVAAKAPASARLLRIMLLGMLAIAVRHDVIDHNPIREVSKVASKRKPVQALSPEDFQRVRAAVAEYCKGRPKTGGPKPGRLLAPFVDVLISTGLRPNEVLGLRWHEVDLLADPPTATVTGKLVPSGRVEGMPLHRQDYRKGDAPKHTVLLPKLAVNALAGLFGEAFPNGLTDDGADRPVFANRNGEWMDLANLRRSLRNALPEDLAWVVPYTTRRTVATVVRDALGPEHAQAQLSHAQLATTELHYLERQTQGPDARRVLDRYAGESADGL